MPLDVVLLYGSYRRDRLGIRLAQFLVSRFGKRGDNPILIDAKAENLPMLDLRYGDYPKGEAPDAMKRIAATIAKADAFVFVAGEYNNGVQPGLKNLVDHFLDDWYWRPAAIACYSQGPFGGVRSMMDWRATLAAMGMPTTCTILPVGQIGQALGPDGEPTGDAGARLERNFPRFADDLAWWAEAARAQRATKAPPY